MHLSGSITALATPFKAAGALDLDAWRRLLQQQSEGGTQGMPFRETFWSPGFGSLTDRFGVDWMVNIAGPDTAGQ